jgi:hypothetical protein
LNVSVIDASAAINVSASGGSALMSRITFANSNDITFGIAAGVITASYSQTQNHAGTNTSVATTAGSALTLGVNTSGVTIGYPNWLTTAAQSSNLLSYYANFSEIRILRSSMFQSNTFGIFPVTIPYGLSIGYLRMLASCIFTSTTIATSAVNNATGASTAFSETMQVNAVLYTMGAGANSRSLQYIYSSSAGLTWAVSVSQASTSDATNCSITQAITFPNEGFTTNSVTTQYSVSATNSPISTTQWSNLSASRYLDIPFATSLPAGNYWLALNRFSGTVGGKNLDVNFSTFCGTGMVNVFGNMNSVTNSSNVYPFIGLGSWTTDVANTTSSIQLAAVSQVVGTNMAGGAYLQFIRQA